MRPGTESKESTEVWDGLAWPGGLERKNKRNKGKAENREHKGRYISHFRPFAVAATEIVQFREDIKIKRALRGPLLNYRLANIKATPQWSKNQDTCSGGPSLAPNF